MYSLYISNKGIKMALESVLLTNILNSSNQLSIYSASKSEVALFSSDNFKNMLKDTFSSNEKTFSKDVDKKKNPALNVLTESSSNKVTASLVVDSYLLNSQDEDLALIYDSEPIFTQSTNGQCIKMFTSNYLNELIDCVNNNELSLDSTIQSLLYISNLLKTIKITQSDICNLTLLSQAKIVTTTYNPIVYFLPLYIVELNRLHYISRFNTKSFEYKKEKQKMYEKMKKQAQRKKEQMLEFAAGFQAPSM